MKTMRYPTPLVYVHQWCTPTKPLAIHLQAVAPYAEPWVFLLPVATQRRPRLRSRRAEVSRHAMRRVPTLAFRPTFALALAFLRLVFQEWDHSWDHRRFLRCSERLVGAPRFELGTPCTPCKCATRLRHAPTLNYSY